MNDDKTLRKNGEVEEEPSHMIYNVREKGDRRSGIDRRLFLYESYVPERRSGIERRGNIDRRRTK